MSRVETKNCNEQRCPVPESTTLALFAPFSRVQRDPPPKPGFCPSRGSRVRAWCSPSLVSKWARRAFFGVVTSRLTPSAAGSRCHRLALV